MENNLITIAKNGSHELDIKNLALLLIYFRIQTEEDVNLFKKLNPIITKLIIIVLHIC